MTSVSILLGGFAPGSYSIEDDGIANNGIARLRVPDGSLIPFSIPTEFLTVTASAGRSVALNLTESFGAADINVAGLDVETSGDLTLTSFGSIVLGEESPDGFGAANGGDVIVNAGRDINLLNSTGIDGSLGAEGTGGGNAFVALDADIRFFV